jgi:uncharacterized protein YbcI
MPWSQAAPDPNACRSRGEDDPTGGTRRSGIAQSSAGALRYGASVLIETPRGPDVLLEVSSQMVRIYKETFGRGPSSARTYWSGPDALTVVLEETLTPAERSLVNMGEHERLRETRLFFQYASIDTLCGMIEQATGRVVRAFVSGIDTRVDGLSVETFVLHPEGYDGPSRAALGKG